MNTNDTLLVKMIAQDMQHKGISEKNYHILEDKMVENPGQIPVKSNEAIYTCYFQHLTNTPFTVQLISGTAAVNYTNNNTRLNNTANYESSIITRHWSTININSQTLEPFIVRYVKVLFK